MNDPMCFCAHLLASFPAQAMQLRKPGCALSQMVSDRIYGKSPRGTPLEAQWFPLHGHGSSATDRLHASAAALQAVASLAGVHSEIAGPVSTAGASEAGDHGILARLLRANLNCSVLYRIVCFGGAPHCLAAWAGALSPWR